MSRRFSFPALIVLLLLLPVLLGSCGDGTQGTTAPTDPASSDTTPGAGSGTTAPLPQVDVAVCENGSSTYTLIFDTTTTSLSSIAVDFRSQLNMLITPSIPMYADSRAEVDQEILLGFTNRTETAAVRAILDAAHSEDAFRYIIAEENGKILIMADSNEGYDYAFDALFDTYGDTAGAVRVPQGTRDLRVKSWADYTADLNKEEEEKTAKEIGTLREQINAFTASDFGKITILDSPYNSPDVYPIEDEHPRVLFTAADLPTIRSNFDSAENASAKSKYLSLSEKETTGILPTPADSNTSNMDYNVLASIEAKAFRYILTGEELYGYQAILAMKNYLNTIVIKSDISDNCRAYGYTMYITACVYDWCYDLLTSADRIHFVGACETKLGPKMEVGFPPAGQGVISGHGCEAQIFRDYLALAIATYDEYPDLYEFVAGRIFTEFLPAQEFYLASGSHWQGSGYGAYRTYFLLFSETLFRGITNGEFSLWGDDLQAVCRTMVSYLRPDGTPLRIGDANFETGATLNLNSYKISFTYAGFLYGDEVCKKYADEMSNHFSQFPISGVALSSVMFLILNDPTVSTTVTEDPLSLVNYNGSPLGSIIARTDWSSDAAMVYMKIGEAYSGNHEHKDVGSFQIYYKGILASDSGAYDSATSTHFYAYAQETIAHNCLLIYNPAHVVPGQYVYSGGQSHGNSESLTLEAWIAKGTTDVATMIGSDYETVVGADGEEQVLFSYLAGDLTNSYYADTVDEVSRYMVSIMTDDPDHPMIFVVYDRITAVEASYRKTFLLHMQTEPTVTGTTASIVNGGGKLMVQSLLDDVTYEAIGGEGKQFWIWTDYGKGEGQNYPYKPFSSEEALEPGWGRIEISPTVAAETNRLLTVMYVTDAENTETIRTAAGIDSTDVVGSVLFGNAVVFPRNTGEIKNAISFTAPQDGSSLSYSVAGLESRFWTVSVNGVAVGEYSVEEGGLLRFTASAGTVTLTPGKSLPEAADQETENDGKDNWEYDGFRS